MYCFTTQRSYMFQYAGDHHQGIRIKSSHTKLLGYELIIHNERNEQLTYLLHGAESFLRS
jgi:hypothetical protein